MKDVDSVATASVSKCNPNGILFIQTSWSFSSQILEKLFFSWQCNPRVHLGHRPLIALCFEGPTTTCVQRANRRRLCWKIHHTGEAVGQLTQLITAQIYYKKCSVFNQSLCKIIRLTESVYVIFYLKILPALGVVGDEKITNVPCCQWKKKYVGTDREECILVLIH